MARPAPCSPLGKNPRPSPTPRADAPRIAYSEIDHRPCHAPLSFATPARSASQASIWLASQAMVFGPSCTGRGIWPSRKSEVLETQRILAGSDRSVVSQAGIIGQKSLLRDRHACPPAPPRPLVPHHPRASLQLEVLALRHQISVYQRTCRRPRISPADRILWSYLARIWAGWRQHLLFVKPDTIIARVSSRPIDSHNSWSDPPNLFLLC